MRQPNILIFMTDQEQADVSLPGHACLTPNADRLVREGVQFRNMYCPAAHCCPSRASLMTGLYPSVHGVYNNISNPTAIRRAPYPGTPMFSDGLKEAGYRLMYSGKWHVSDDEGPADRGWEELEVTANKGAYQHRSPDQWRDQAPSDYSGERPRGMVRRPGWGDRYLYRTLPVRGERGYDEKPDWKVIAPALGALEQLTKQTTPWCLYVGPQGPHDPFHVPENFVKMYDLAQVPLPPNYHDRCEDKPRVYQRIRRQYWDQLSEDEIREAVQHYWAYCTMEDTYFGLFLDTLDASGQREDTLILRFSDHGEYAGAHGLFCKGVPAFREGYNVPCIVSWPGHIQQEGRLEDSFVTLADIAPTLLEVAGVTEPPGLTGRSMTPFLKDSGPPDGWRDAFYSQMNGVELYYTQRAVQTHDWKYVYNGFDFDELYDLRNDPHEIVNLAGDRTYDEVKRDLVRKMWRFAGETNDHIFNQYATVALAPWGPGDTFYEPDPQAPS